MGILVFYMIMGFERPLRKHAGGMFLGRGRIHGYPNASHRDVGGYPFFGISPLDVCSFYLGGYGIQRGRGSLTIVPANSITDYMHFLSAILPTIRIIWLQSESKIGMI